MKHFAEFLKTTLIGGLLVLFPLFGCLYLTFRIAGALTSVIKPLLNFLPQNRLVGVAVADAASVLILLILCFVIGLIIRTSVGNALGVQPHKLGISLCACSSVGGILISPDERRSWSETH